DHPQQGRGLRSEGYADADFVCTACDGVGDEAVGTDGGEEDGKAREDGGEPSDETLGGDGAFDFGGQRFRLSHGDLRGYFGDDAANRGDEGASGDRGLDGEVAEVLNALGVGEVGGHVPAFTHTDVFCVADNADDFDVEVALFGMGGGGIAEAEVMTEG